MHASMFNNRHWAWRLQIARSYSAKVDAKQGTLLHEHGMAQTSLEFYSKLTPDYDKKNVLGIQVKNFSKLIQTNTLTAREPSLAFG